MRRIYQIIVIGAVSILTKKVSKILLLSIALGLLTGCQPALTQAEREWRESIDRENWMLCQMAYANSGIPTVSHHDHRRHKLHRWHEVREDLTDNQCRMHLKDFWVDY